MSPISIIIHHSVSSKKTTISQLNEWHKARDFPLSSLGFYIGYHYVILGDGTVKQVRRDNEIGAHSPPNTGRLGICLTGNFNIEEPSDAQIKSLLELTEKLKSAYGIQDIKGHREFNKTECPGENLYKWVLEQRISWLQRLINIIKGKTKVE